MSQETTNVVLAGVGGQGVLKASDILADAAFLSGQDVKKAELHGMSQRGGSVSSDVRFGSKVLSPMVPEGEAHFLVVLDVTQATVNIHRLAEGGVLIAADLINESDLPRRRCLNVALLGILSNYLPLETEQWKRAICANLDAEYHEDNLEAFEMGRELGAAKSDPEELAG